jgi:CubicO group peptidase (beta-lactamase class C family)
MNRCLYMLLGILLIGCGNHPDRTIQDRDVRVRGFLNDVMRDDEYPGIQYVVVDSGNILFEYDGGWADILHRHPMKSSTTMMAYSMTKTFTAAAILQLAEQGKLSLNDSVVTYIPSSPYDRGLRIRHLVSQTSGIPDPVPLSWVHLAQDHRTFDERRALDVVLKEHSKLEFSPGEKYAYSNISYWLLEVIIEKVSGESYQKYMSENIFAPLNLTPSDAGFTIPDASNQAKGYLKKYSFMNLFKSFLLDGKFIGDYEERWLHINDHYLNGPGFGGMVASAQAVAAFLQDQMKQTSALFSNKTRKLFYTQQKSNSGRPIAMTLGWHIGDLNGNLYYYKEGGGGGYHSEMRLYPKQKLATVIMVNETSSRCTDLQNVLDKEFVPE